MNLRDTNGGQNDTENYGAHNMPDIAFDDQSDRGQNIWSVSAQGLHFQEADYRGPMGGHGDTFTAPPLRTREITEVSRVRSGRTFNGITRLIVTFRCRKRPRAYPGRRSSFPVRRVCSIMIEDLFTSFSVAGSVVSARRYHCVLSPCCPPGGPAPLERDT